MNLHNFSFFFLESFNIFYLKKGEKCHKGSINSCNTWWLLYQNQERKRCLFTVQTLISFHVNLLLIKYNLCGMKCWCSHTVIETNWVLFIKIHNFIRKILLPLKCKSLPPPTLKSFCTGVTGTTAAGSQMNGFCWGVRWSLPQLRWLQVLQSHVVAETVLLLKDVKTKRWSEVKKKAKNGEQLLSNE